MRSFSLIALVPALAQAINIVLSNDDGWAELNIREFYNALTNAGHSIVLSASAYNRSGTGSSDFPPTPLLTPGEFNSIPAGSPGVGNNASMPRFNYVNSFPATAMRYGIQTFSPRFFNGAKPDLALAGFNVGANTGPIVQLSGTVGATIEAVRQGIPGIAFSGTSGDQISWLTTPIPDYVSIYTALSLQVTQTLIAATVNGENYLPSSTWLNVNFPAVTSSCNDPGRFKYVLSRIYDATPLSGKDVFTCGSDRLPTEANVVDTPGCYVSVSVGRSPTKFDAGIQEQAIVLRKLGSLLSCLPAGSEM